MRVHFWCPSWGTPCGIAEYTRALVEALPGATASADPPDDLAEIDVLHVQHEFGLFGPYLLPPYLEFASRRATTVVTEHSVVGAWQPFEARAHGYAALTAEGAARIAARASGPVAHLPHGCPDWDPPRKATRGRVLGAFGFLDRYKGYWELADAAARLDAELVLYSHDRLGVHSADFARHIAGKPVRWTPDFLPAEEIAARLAAEADILVNWYHPAPFASASGATRLALATGIPVLASRVNWMADFGDATYQADDLDAGIAALLGDEALRDRTTRAARAYCEAHRWPEIARQHLAFYDTLR